MYSQSFRSFSASLLPFLFFRVASASVTVYGYEGAVTSTVSGEKPTYTGSQAYNPIELSPPPVPNPAPATAFNIAVHDAAPGGLSIKLDGSFMGFSIEFSVLDQVLGSNSSVIQVPFLNLMANIKDRAGSVHIRVGGNTQETASLVESLPDGKILFKDNNDTDNPTKTPPTVFTEDLIYMMANISSLVNVKWFMGIPFNDTANFRLQIAEKGQAILGDYLVGLQVGNEPDLYAKHFRRPDTYSPADYGNDFGQLVKALQADTSIKNPNMLIGPNLAGTWKPEDIWNTGFAETYKGNLGALGVERYPTDNCFARYGYGVYHDAQQKFVEYMTHASAQHIVSEYLGSAAYAQTLNKPLMMFETNSASCGGFPGISDAFGASLWGLDYALQMAYSNFSVAMFHVGGQNVSYNPFVPPPTAQVDYHEWTVGPIYYSALVMAEVLGSSGVAQVLDLFPNNANEFQPAYGVYENGKLVRMAMFNYITDPSGANDYTATISVGGGATNEANATPAQVHVKYLTAKSTAQKGNITWAGQTFGGFFESDGRLKGTEDIRTVACDTNANTCQVKVPAPGFALVYFSDPALAESYNEAQQTFATTRVTKTINTATVNEFALATSNGGRGKQLWMGSTSPYKKKNAAFGFSRAMPSILALAGLVCGGLAVGRML